jgi:hypothetical protein
MSLKPENSSAGWPKFGEHFNPRTDSTYKRGQIGEQVTACGRPAYELQNLRGEQMWSISLHNGARTMLDDEAQVAYSNPTPLLSASTKGKSYHGPVPKGCRIFINNPVPLSTHQRSHPGRIVV